MRIALLTNSLGPGGAERVVATLANSFARTDSVSVITLSNRADTSVYQLDPAVDVQYLDLLRPSSGAMDAIRNNVLRIRALRKTLRKTAADILISFLPETNVLALLSARGSGSVLVCEHTDPEGTPVAPPWNWLRSLAYRRADAIIVLNTLARRYFESRFRVPVIVIPNPVSLPEDSAEAPALPVPYLLTVGRLEKNKRVGDVIEAFAQLLPRYPSMHLVIVGAGPQRRELAAVVHDLGVDAKVIFTGAIRVTRALYQNAELFVSASVTEAFPMAICEAMSCGTPVVVREYSESARELITTGQNGILIGSHSPDELVSAIDGLLGDSDQRRAVGERARESARAFRVDTVTEYWHRLFNALADGSVVNSRPTDNNFRG